MREKERGVIQLSGIGNKEYLNLQLRGEINDSHHGGSSYLEEVFNPLSIVAVALPADPLHLFDLARFAGGLDVLEVDVGLLAEVHDGAEEVKQALDGETTQNSAGSLKTERK